MTDPVLQANGVKADYWKTGHSYIKRRVNELGALAGFEKSGHFFFNKPFGRGYDDGLIFALAVCDMLDRNPGKTHGGPEATRCRRPGARRPCRRIATTRRNTAWSTQVVKHFEAAQGEGREGRRPADPRSRHRQRRARHGRGRHLGPGARLVEQAGAGGGGRKPGRRRRACARCSRRSTRVLRTHPEVGEYNQTI